MHTRTLALLALTIVAGAASAAPTYYFGADDGADSTDPRPNSDAAAAAFDAAAGGLGTINMIDFESAPVGSFSSLGVAPGVTLTGSDYNSADQTIRNSPYSLPEEVWSYNTTAGGAQFANMYGGTLTFTFASPISAFGAYFTGVQTFSGHAMSFDDGAPQSYSFNMTSDGGVMFLGFTDAGASISSVTIDVTDDVVGMDDVRYVGLVPEPATFAVVGLGALALIRRKK